MPPLRLFLTVCAMACYVLQARAQTDNAFTTNVFFTVTNAAEQMFSSPAA